MVTSEAILYLAITNHGFGHAVRMSSIAGAITALRPEITLILATNAPRWLLESYIDGDFIYRPRTFDVGVIQADSLQMDREATLSQWEEIRRQQKAIIASEANYLRINRVNLVLADLPPLAAPIAKAAGLDCWMLGNFGWDFIYRDWGEDFVAIADWIGECYQQCDRLFRLPLCEPMTAFPHITDVGLTGGNPRYPKEKLLQEFGLTAAREKTALLTFGGLGLHQIPYHNLSQFPDWQFIAFDQLAPTQPNLISVKDRSYRPVDFMPYCGRVISKPGYSTFAEALRCQTPVVSLTRSGFAESELLLKGIQNYSLHQIITPEEFIQGDWSFLHQPLNPPQSTLTLDKQGSETIAQAVLTYLDSL